RKAIAAASSSAAVAWPAFDRILIIPYTVSGIRAFHKRRSAMFSSRPRLSSLVALLFTLSAPAVPVAAQVLYGSLVGNVTDSTGSAVPGAIVTVTNAETGASHEATTDGTGAYRFTNVQPGTYKVTIKLEGFRTFTRSDVPVTLNSVARVDAALQ